MTKRKYQNPKAGYDPACEVLANQFLSDDPVDDPLAPGSLASAIQRAVEDWYATDAPELRAVKAD